MGAVRLAFEDSRADYGITGFSPPLTVAMQARTRMYRFSVCPTGVFDCEVAWEENERTITAAATILRGSGLNLSMAIAPRAEWLARRICAVLDTKSINR
jgi:hypothetical protein